MNLKSPDSQVTMFLLCIAKHCVYWEGQKVTFKGKKMSEQSKKNRNKLFIEYFSLIVEVNEQPGYTREIMSLWNFLDVLKQAFERDS